MCHRWFKPLKCSNLFNIFNKLIEDYHIIKKVLKVEKLETLLNEDLCQSQEELTKSLGATEESILKYFENLQMM